MKWFVWLLAFFRSIIFAIGQIVTLLFFSMIGGLFLWPFSAKVRYQFMHYWAKFCVWWVKVTCGVSYEVYGQENINNLQVGLVFARHESAWETFATQVIFPPQTFVLKKELLKIPFFGWGMRLLDPIAIDRNAGRKALKQVVVEGTQRLENGIWVIIFPEGTRMPHDEIGKINSGGAMLAIKAKRPVVLMMHNAGEFWPKNSFIKRPGKIKVYLSQPIDTTDLSVAQLNELTQEWFVQHHQTIGDGG